MDRAPLATVRFAPQLAFAAAFTGLCVCLCSATPSADSAKGKKDDSINPSSLSAAPEPKVPARLVFADPYPSPAQKPDRDLLLSESSELRAQAMEWFVFGSALEERGQADVALEFFKKSLSRDPGNVSLALRIASFFTQSQQHPEALRILKDAAQAAPSDPAPLVEIARIYLSGLRQPDNALSYAEKAYRLAPEHFPALAIFTEVCSTAKLSQRLEDLLKRTEALKSPDASFWLSAGDLFRNAFSLRSNSLNRATLERINALFRKAMDLAPLDVRCLERTADHHTLTRQFPEACLFYERAQNLFREQNQKVSSPQISLKWARALLLNERPDNALETLEELIQEQPQQATAREMAGELYLQQGQFISALGHLRLALEIDPSELNDHLRVIQLQLRLRRPTDAIVTARQAQKYFPNAANLTMLLAMALSESKQAMEAVKAFELTERQYHESDREALNAAFYMTFGAAAERAGLLEKAASILKKSIDLDPENAAEAMNYLGYMWIDRNEHLDEAGRLVQKALQLRPNHPAYLDSLAWWHFRKGQFSEAEKSVRRALESIRREDSSEVYDHMGDILEKLERPAEAIAAWEAALEMDPSMPGPKAKLERLRPTKP